MTSLMMPAPAAATMTTMTNTAPIAVTQPGVGKPDVAKIGFITNNRQGKTKHFTKTSKFWVHRKRSLLISNTIKTRYS